MIRAALVGCGQISRWHLNALRDIPAVAVVAVCDRDPFRARNAAELAQGARVYTDLAALLRQEHPDAVHVLTPPDSHATLAAQAMEAGCHVLIEKPMALNLPEADHLIDVARHNDVKLCVNHNYLFNPSILKARDVVQSGAVGQVVYVNSYYGLSGEGGAYAGGSRRAHWAWRLPGGVFTNFLPHLIYLQLALLGEAVSVTGVSMGQPHEPDSFATELTVLLQGSDAPGVMTISMRARPYAKFVDIYGTKGMIHADLVREVCTVKQAWRLPRMLSKVAFSLQDSVQLAAGTAENTVKVIAGRLKNMPGMHGLIQAFYASVQNDHAPPVSGENGRQVVEVMAMVWDQARKPRAHTHPTPLIQARDEALTDVERSLLESEQLALRALVTGATGFLGGYLVPALARCRADVAALIRDLSRVSPELECQARLICGDVREPASVEAAMQGMDVVFHCAAITSNKAPWVDHAEINIRGTETVLRAALMVGVKRVVHVSSVIVYGLETPRPHDPIHESAPCAHNPDRWAHYLRSKLEADKLALRYWHEHGLPVTVLRLGILYGPGLRQAPGRGLGQLGALRFLIGDGHNRLPYTYVGNAVDCLLLAAVSPQAVGQIYNVVDEPQLTVRQAARLNIAYSGDHTTLVPTPRFLFFALARLLELRSELKGGCTPPGLSRYVVHSGSRDLQYDTTKARQQLGWQPAVTLEEGLRKTIASLAV